MNNIEKDALINYENIISKKHILRSEDEIISKWSENIPDPIISIFCITYNQELYIEDTIRGFLIQETDFPFEVLIHDDASTDSTAQIIKSYEKKYPKIIKPIYQKENQYSKGIKISQTFNLPRAKGKFIAFCEGDDFWIDKNKLTKQIVSLQQEPEVNICFTASLELHSSGTKNIACQHSYVKSKFTPDEIITGGGGFIPTCSIVLKRSVLEGLPEWFYEIAPVGDYFIQILASLHQGALYIPDPTCVYRVNAIGSWSLRAANTNASEYANEKLKMAYCLNEINLATNYKYDDSFKQVLASIYLNCAVRYLSESKHLEVKEYINLSWNQKKNLNYKQVILKRLSRLSPLISRYLLLKKNMKANLHRFNF